MHNVRRTATVQKTWHDAYSRQLRPGDPEWHVSAGHTPSSEARSMAYLASASLVLKSDGLRYSPHQRSLLLRAPGAASCECRLSYSGQLLFA